MSGACLDPETLALWVDDGLSAAERAAAERHVADCARCQATLAALVRTAPVAARRPWWRLSRAVWLAPVTAAAAALVIWFAVPASPPPRSPQPSLPASAPVAAAPQAAKEETENKPAPTATPPARERRDDKRLGDKSPASAVAAAPPPAVPLAPPASPALSAQPQAFSGIATADGVTKSARQANAVAAEIVSPDPIIRWRISAGSSIEHSTDGGITWQQQATGTASSLAAGSAPSASICWVVGQDGVVLLSTDGRTWRQVNVPTTTALVSVRATDDRTATVTDADGRTYVTTDGGTTWAQR